MFHTIRGRIAAAYALLLAVTLAGLGIYLAAVTARQPAPTPADLQDAVTRGALVAFLLSSLVSILLAGLVARITTTPLRQFAGFAGQLRNGDLGARAGDAPPDETSDLAAALSEMARAVSDRVQALSAERARLEAVLAHMDDGVLIVDDARRVQMMNPAAVRLLESAADGVGGRPLIEVVRDYEMAEITARALTDRGAPTPRVIEIGRPRRSLQVLATRLPDATPRVLLVLQDVTDLRQAETIRREFVANVSHELRTPLASLRALVETLEDGALDDPTVAHDFLGRMRVEVDGLTVLIEELLELARLESGRAMQPAPLDLGAVAAQAVERMRAQAERHGVTLQMATTGPLPQVQADPARMEQAVINLLHNAIKFTPPGGEVIVTVQARQECVQVSVSDTGDGIAVEDLPRVFERFYKADKSRASGGSGLGLAIAKHTVQAHGGRIWAESSGPGRGAVFTMEMPIASKPAD